LNPLKAYVYEEVIEKSEYIGMLPDVDGKRMECYATPSLSEPKLLILVEFTGSDIIFYTKTNPTKEEVEACVTLFREQKDTESPAMVGIKPLHLMQYLNKHT
jgi:hypothetical protein